MEQTPKEIENRTIAAIKRMNDAIRNGTPLRSTQVRQEQTPDGPLTTFTKGTWVSGEFIPNESENE